MNFLKDNFTIKLDNFYAFQGTFSGGPQSVLQGPQRSPTSIQVVYGSTPFATTYLCENGFFSCKSQVIGLCSWRKSLIISLSERILFSVSKLNHKSLNAKASMRLCLSSVKAPVRETSKCKSRKALLHNCSFQNVIIFS